MRFAKLAHKIRRPRIRLLAALTAVAAIVVAPVHPPGAAAQAVGPVISVATSGQLDDFDSDGIIEPGEAVHFQYTVNNAGDVPLTNIELTEAIASQPTCPQTALAVGEEMVCHVSHVITQAEANQGSVMSEVTARGDGPSGSAEPVSHSTEITFDKVARLGITKSGYPFEIVPNGILTFSTVIVNTGNVTMTITEFDTDFTDPQQCSRLPAEGGETVQLDGIISLSLDAGEQVICTAQHKLPSDAHYEEVLLFSRITAVDPDGASRNFRGRVRFPFNVTTDMEVHVFGIPDDNNGNDQPDPGEDITYTVIVKNTGSAPLDSVELTDPATSCSPETLLAGELAHCYVTRPLTQAEFDAGTATQAVTASAVERYGSTTLTGADTATNNLEGLEVTTVAPDGFVEVGDTISYVITISNTGTTAASGITVTDTALTGLSCPDGSIGRGESIECTASHVVTQADLDAGTIEGTTTVTATDALGATMAATAGHSHTAATTPLLSLSKSGSTNDIDGDGIIEAGETVTQTVVVTNTSTAAVTNLSVTDDAGPATCESTDLAAGTTTVCTVTYTLTQTDIYNGSLATPATATATDASGETTSATASVEAVTLKASPRLKLTSAFSQPKFEAGETLDLTVTVINTGNVAIGDITAANPLTADMACAATRLAPGAQTTCVGTYTFTQEDIDVDHVEFSTTVSGSDDSEQPVSQVDRGTFLAPAVSKISLVATSVTSDTDGDGMIEAGESVTHTIEVTNSGNQPLVNVTVTEPNAEVSCVSASVAPGKSTTCTAISTVTQDDIDTGSLAATVTVTAADQWGMPVSATASGDAVPLVASPRLEITSTSNATELVAGEIVEITVTVANTGNVTIGGISATNSLNSDVECPVDTVAPGEQITCSASYAMTPDDVSAETITATTTVKGTDPSGGSVEQANTVTIPQGQPVSFTVTVADQPTIADGANDDEIMIQPDKPLELAVLIVNTGAVEMSGIVPQAEAPAKVSCPETSLASGAEMTCTATFTPTADDVSNGDFTGSVTVSATNPGGVETAVTAGTTVAIKKVSALDVVVTSAGADTDGDGTLEVGELVVFTATVHNMGNTTVTGIEADGPMTGSMNCATTQLAPGESTTCTAIHELTAADVELTTLSTTATANGQGVDGAVQAAATVTTDFNNFEAAPADAVKAGDTSGTNPPNSGTGTAANPPASLPITGSSTSRLVALAVVLMALGTSLRLPGKRLAPTR